MVRHGPPRRSRQPDPQSQPCLDAGSFLVPQAEDRMILGRNIYGAVTAETRR
jgi:hypothetical protein